MIENVEYYVYSDHLEHHGIKGQRWGIRRYQNADGSLTLAGKARYRDTKNGTTTDEFTLSKGSTVYRVSTTKNENLSGGSTYVSMYEPERNLYKGYWNRELARNQAGDPNAKTYEHELVLKKDLKVPSRETVAEVIDSLKSDPRAKREVISYYAANAMRNTYGFTLQNARELVDKRVENKPLTLEVNGRKYDLSSLSDAIDEKMARSNHVYKTSSSIHGIAQFTGTFGVNDYAKSLVVNELKKRGFNAMTDAAGVGKKGYREGVQPLIVFDNSVFEEKKSKAISNSARRSATYKYMQWYSDQQQKDIRDEKKRNKS